MRGAEVIAWPKGMQAGRSRGRERALGLAVGTAGLVAAYVKLLIPRLRRWGATGEEVSRPMPGDELVAHPMDLSTRAVTVEARPEDVWPWLLQMGYQRGGLYSLDRLDMLFGVLEHPSTDRVLPQYQDLKQGDVMPYAPEADMRVEHLEPYRHLLLRLLREDVQVTQSWGLYPLDGERTRLVLRVRGNVPLTWKNLPAILALDPTETIMVRAQLLGIKRRAEALAEQRRQRAGGTRGV